MNTPSSSLQNVSRRRFIGTTAAAAAAGIFTLRPAGAAQNDGVSFFLIGDTHFCADSENPGMLDEASAEVGSRLIETLNKLPGTTIPAASRAGMVSAPRGLIHVGDLIDSGDKEGPVFSRMQQTEWEAWNAGFGLTGTDGKLKYPVYEIHGNHDAPHGKGLVLDHIIARNKERPGVGNISSNGLHYSWDWGHVHFVCLGLIVGTAPEVTRKRRFAALDSLEFLRADLAEKVGKSGRPVVLLHHVDIGRYTSAKGCDPDAPFENKEWDPCDVHSFYEAIRGYQIAAIFYGHTHARNVFKWDGAGTKAASGIPIFNVDNSSHYKMDAQAFFHVEISESELVVREYASADRWETGAWTPASWVVPLTAAV
ncbi:MAG: metallophosphoesterase [Chthoniobacteraceae bacterium]|nr:metallophosphoesterase [Chthoniobacteraceae bacterium]